MRGAAAHGPVPATAGHHGCVATVAFQPVEPRTGRSEILVRARNLWTRCGPRFAVLWLLQGTVCRLLRLRVVHIIVHESHGANDPQQLPPPGYELRIATPEELARGVPEDPTFPDAPTLQQYLAAGDLMIAAFHGGRIVSYGWCSTGPAAIAEDLTISFGPGFLYGHRAYTTLRHRGKGLHAAIITYSRRVAAERGQAIVAYVDANNYRSLISESRVGRLTAGVVVISLRPGRLRYWATALCREVGFSLARPQAKKTPDRVGR